MNQHFGDIIQIIPAPPGLMALSEGENEGETIRERVVCLALEKYRPAGPVDEEETFITAYTADPNGDIRRVDYYAEFIGFAWGEEG